MIKIAEVEGNLSAKERNECHRMASLIVRYFFRDLRPSQRREVEAHLSNCPECMDRYRALDAAYSATSGPRG